MEMLEKNLETQMAKGHLFLSCVDPPRPPIEAQALLEKVGGDFIERYESIIPERRCLIYQYGVHPDGGLLDLRDIEQQLKKEWIAVASLWADGSRGPSGHVWMLEYAPSAYQGRTLYSIPFLCRTTVDKIQYSGMGTHDKSHAVDDAEASAAMQITAHILQRQETVGRAEQLLIAHQGFEKKLGELCVSAPDSSVDISSQEKEIQELRQLVKRITFK